MLRRLASAVCLFSAILWLPLKVNDAADQGTSAFLYYVIVIAKNADLVEQTAPQDLQRFIRRRFRSDLWVVNEEEKGRLAKESTHWIVLRTDAGLGRTGSHEKSRVNLPTSGESFELHSDGTLLYVTGSDPRGVLQGVSGLRTGLGEIPT